MLRLEWSQIYFCPKVLLILTHVLARPRYAVLAPPAQSSPRPPRPLPPFISTTFTSVRPLPFVATFCRSSPVVATQAATTAACDAAVVRLHPAFVPPCCCTATSACVRLSRLLAPICCRLGPRAVVTGNLPPREALRTRGPGFSHAPLFF